MIFEISNISDIVGNNASGVTTLSSGIPVDIDTIKPVITILGDNPQIVDLNTIYTEQGATATDNIDGNLTSSIIMGKGKLTFKGENTSKPAKKKKKSKKKWLNTS